MMFSMGKRRGLRHWLNRYSTVLSIFELEAFLFLLLKTHSFNSSKVMSLSRIFVSSTIRVVLGMSARRAVIRETVKLLLL